MDESLTVMFPVGLEEGDDGATLVHSFTLPGCVAGGATQEEALDAFTLVLEEWLTRDGHELTEELDRLFVPANDARWLRRNALVALGNDPDGDPALAEPFLDDEEPAVRTVARRAVKRLAERA